MYQLCISSGVKKSSLEITFENGIMNLIILLAVVASANCAKLDRTYLPPHAQTSGGSSNILETPNFEPSPFQTADENFGRRNFAQENQPQSVNNFAPNGAAPTINGDFAPADINRNPAENNAVAPNDYSEGSGFAPPDNFAGNFEPKTNFASSANFAPSANFVNDDSITVDSFGANNPGSDFAASPVNGPFERPERPRAALDRNAAILRMDSRNDGETYAYAYETENGISADETGVATNGVEAQGGFSYTGDDGKVYTIRYTADQNGFVPQGEHLPTPPPIPEEILKALEQNARDEAAGIFDDGSYNAEKYGDANAQYNEPQQGNNANYPTETNNLGNDNNYADNSGNFAPENSENFAPQNPNAFPSNNFAANANFAQEDQDTVVTNSADDISGFGNQRAPSFRGSPNDNKSRGPAYLPPVRR